MSAAPLQIDGNDARWGVPLGKGLTVRDGLWCGLIDDHVNLTMGMTAENLAEKYNISREDCDAFAFRRYVLQKLSSCFLVWVCLCF